MREMVVRQRKRKRKTLVIELVAVFLQLVALPLDSLRSTSLAACFPSPPPSAYFTPLHLAIASPSSANIYITSFSITGNF